MKKTLKITGCEQTDLRIYWRYRRLIERLPLDAGGKKVSGFKIDKNGNFFYTHLQVLQNASNEITRKGKTL